VRGKVERGVDGGGVCHMLVRGVGMVEVEEGDGSEMITNGKDAPAYINVEPDFLVCSLVLGGVVTWTRSGLVGREGGLDVGAEVPGVDIGLAAKGGIHDVGLGGIEVDLGGGLDGVWGWWDRMG